MLLRRHSKNEVENVKQVEEVEPKKTNKKTSKKVSD